MSRREYNPFETETRVGIIESIDYEKDTCSVRLLDNLTTYDNVWIHYHCTEDEEDTGGSSPFGVGDKVLCLFESGLIREVYGWADGVRLQCTTNSFYAFRYTSNRLIILHQNSPEDFIYTVYDPGFDSFNLHGGVLFQFDETYFNVLHIVEYVSYTSSGYLYNFRHKIVQFTPQLNESTGLIELNSSVIQNWTNLTITGEVLGGWNEFTFDNLSISYEPRFEFIVSTYGENTPVFHNEELYMDGVPYGSSETYDIDGDSGILYVTRYQNPGWEDAVEFWENAYQQYYIKKKYGDQILEQKPVYTETMYQDYKNYAFRHFYPYGSFAGTCGYTQPTGAYVNIYLENVLLKSIPEEQLLGTVSLPSNVYLGLWSSASGSAYCRRVSRKQVQNIEVWYSGKFLFLTVTYTSWRQVVRSNNSSDSYCDMNYPVVILEKVETEVRIFKEDNVIKSAADIDLDKYLNYGDVGNFIKQPWFYGWDFSDTISNPDTYSTTIPYAMQPFNFPATYDTFEPKWFYTNGGSSFSYLGKMYYNFWSAFSYGTKKDWYLPGG